MDLDVEGLIRGDLGEPARDRDGVDPGLIEADRDARGGELGAGVAQHEERVHRARGAADGVLGEFDALGELDLLFRCQQVGLADLPHKLRNLAVRAAEKQELRLGNARCRRSRGDTGDASHERVHCAAPRRTSRTSRNRDDCPRQA